MPQTTASANDLDKIAGLQSNASEIDALYGSRIDKLFLGASNGSNTEVTYIVTGDSTRHNSYNKMIEYYTTQLSKINVSVFNNSESGQESVGWLTNDTYSTASLQHALDATIGDGDNTILEFSLGINDWDGIKTQAEVKAEIKSALTSYIASKPKTYLFLVTPVITGNTVRNIGLKEIYNELASELSLPLIDGTIPTESVHGNETFYFDATHPNKYGANRLVNYILNRIIPIQALSKIDLEEYPQVGTPPSALELFDGNTESGYYSLESGLPGPNESWVRITNAIAIEPNFVINIEHYGDRTVCLFYDSDDNFVSYEYIINGQVTVPLNCWYLRFTITSDVASWTDQTVSVKYELQEIEVPNINTINKTLPLNFATPTKTDEVEAITIENGTITIDMTNFISVGKNLFDKTNIISDKYLNNLGYAGTSTSYFYIPYYAKVKPSTEYVSSGSLRFVTYYDKDKNVVDSGISASVTSFTTFSNVEYIRFTGYPADLDTLQVEEGTTSTTYEDFNYGIDLPNGARFTLS